MVVCPGLELSQEDACLLATLASSPGHSVLDPAELRECIAQAGYGQWMLFDEALEQLLNAVRQGDSCTRLKIGEKRDGTFSLEIAEDAMQAWLAVLPACGGDPVNPEDVFLALGAAGVTFGIDPDAIAAACTAIAVDRVLIATGESAVNGEDARFDLLVSDARDRTPKVNAQGVVDFRELGEIPVVEPDQPLMRRIPATRGQPGRNVRGGEVPAEPGRDAVFSEHLEGAYVDRDDSCLLRATFSGQPVSSVNGVNVEHVLRLRNVNMATGNIAFDGTVQIEGEVMPGMKVNVTGDIIVGSVIDGATLVAGGDIRIGGGAIAKAIVKAAGAVTVRFVENAQVVAGTTLAIEDTALQADLQANNQILVGVKNPRGKLAGGSARAMLLIQTPVLGAASGGVTQLLLGVNPVLDAKYLELLQTIEKRKEEEDKLDKLVKHLAKQGDKSGMLERANASWQAAVKAWGALLPERQALEQALAQMAEAKVVIGTGVEGAVDVGFGKKRQRLRQSLGPGVLSLQDDEIAYTDAAGNVVLLP